MRLATFLAVAALVPTLALAQPKPPASSTITLPPAPAAGPATITPVPTQPAAPLPAPAPAAAPAPPSAEALREAKALTDVLGIPAQAKAVLAQIRGQVIQATIAASGKSVAEASAIADELMMPEFANKEQDLANALILPWANGFTPAEMRDLRTFYGTPLGKRLLATMPIVTQQTVQVGQEWMQKTFRDAVAKHADELRARGLKF
jgi:hypothetical protein